MEDSLKFKNKFRTNLTRVSNKQELVPLKLDDKEIGVDEEAETIRDIVEGRIVVLKVMPQRQQCNIYIYIYVYIYMYIYISIYIDREIEREKTNTNRMTMEKQLVARQKQTLSI